MDAHSLAVCRARARVVKAFAHPVRLFMVDQLAKSGEMCLRELAARAGTTEPTAARHLAFLKAAGIVRDQKRGAKVYNSVQVSVDFGFFRCVERVLRRDSDRVS